MSKKKKKRNRSFSFSRKSICHAGPVEVIPGLFCGSEDEFLKGLETGLLFEVLVPLSSLCGSIWNMGFRGEILYYPITDFSVLPNDVLEEIATRIISRIHAGKKVGIFCMGGHGRTGYVASVVLGKLGYADPIGYLREKYCKNAVESTSQVNHIAAIFNKPELAEKYAVKEDYPLWYEGYYTPYQETATLLNENEEPRCCDCAYFISDSCLLFDQVHGDQPACWDFKDAYRDF